MTVSEKLDFICINTIEANPPSSHRHIIMSLDNLSDISIHGSNESILTIFRAWFICLETSLSSPEIEKQCVYMDQIYAFFIHAEARSPDTSDIGRILLPTFTVEI